MRPSCCSCFLSTLCSTSSWSRTHIPQMRYLFVKLPAVCFYCLITMATHLSIRCLLKCKGPLVHLEGDFWGIQFIAPAPCAAQSLCDECDTQETFEIGESAANSGPGRNNQWKELKISGWFVKGCHFTGWYCRWDPTLHCLNLRHTQTYFKGGFGAPFADKRPKPQKRCMMYYKPERPTPNRKTAATCTHQCDRSV